MGKIYPMHQKGGRCTSRGLRNTAGMAMGSQNFEFQDYMGVIKLSSLEFLVVPNIDQNCKPISFMIYIAIYMNM